MKKLLIVLAVLTTGLLACSKQGFLDQTTTTDLDENSVFSDSARSMDFLAQIYTGIGYSFTPSRFSGLAGLDASSDEAEGPLATGITTYSQFASGSISAFTISTDAWTAGYQNIRAVNQFLAHLSVIPFNEDLKQRTRGEAMFLRAWYYALMLKHYGGVPLVGDTVYNVNDNIKTSRNTYEECVNYILQQCDEAASYLSTSYSGLNYGRITKGACLALKAKVLLYAASPLYNGQGIADAEPLKSITGYPSFDINRWKLAADAAKAVIDLNQYQLYEDNNTKAGYGFYQLFQLRVNTEYILARMNGDNRDLEGLWRPPSRGGNSTSGAFPSQNLVDAFEMNNGLPITDPSSGYDAQHPYDNRDPRLDYTVSHNGSMIYKSLQSVLPIYTYDGEPNGDATGVGTPTGYYGNKMCNDLVVPDYIGSASQRCLPLIRYADVLLMYAEALNEYEGPTQDVYDAVQAIRKRAGLLPYELTPGLSQEQMRSVIRHERQVELAFEESRFWDVRRWKLAEQTEDQVLKGMKVTKNADGSFTYNVINVRDRSFRTPMYLWPLPYAETAKSAELLQNPGY